jgi:hypothetical protein
MTARTDDLSARLQPQTKYECVLETIRWDFSTDFAQMAGNLEAMSPIGLEKRACSDYCIAGEKPVGSGKGATLRRFDLSVALRFL